MKTIKIFDPEDQGTIFLRLIDGCRLVVVNSAGKEILRGSICKITPEGELYLNSQIPPDIGLKLDAEGHIVVQHGD